uniref:CHHC U11-48K-type domain-containing protein n=1 Tax=Leptobrachium leishanense TaxID=445787 RepID=A0A8C5M7J3_9ANUR
MLNSHRSLSESLLGRVYGEAGNYSKRKGGQTWWCDPIDTFIQTDGLLQCPYDINHRIRPSRFPYHLVKCRENNPSAAKFIVACPYNARHRVPKNELDLHMATCGHKVSLDNLVGTVVSKYNATKQQCESAWNLTLIYKQEICLYSGFPVLLSHFHWHCPLCQQK